MSVQLLLACCCGSPLCPVYGGCESPGWGSGSVQRTLASATFTRLTQYNFPSDGIVGTCINGPTTVSAVSQAPLGECGNGAIFVGAGTPGPSGLQFGWDSIPVTESTGTASCGPILDIPVSVGGSIALNTAGEIVASGGADGAVSVVAVTFSGDTYTINYPDTSDTWTGTNLQVSMEVEWIQSGGVRGALVSFRSEAVQDLPPGDGELGIGDLVTVDFLVYGVAWNDTAAPIEVCDPEFVVPPFEPPDWYEPVDPPLCAPGCAPGPVGFQDHACDSGLGGEGDDFGPLPTEEEWPPSLWLCGSLVFTNCPNGCRVRRFVPCGNPPGLGDQEICSTIGPITPGSAVESPAQPRSLAGMDPASVRRLEEQNRLGGCNTCGDGFQG